MNQYISPDDSKNFGDWKYILRVIVGLFVFAIIFYFITTSEPKNILLLGFKNWFISVFWCCAYVGIFFLGYDWYKNYDIVKINFIELPPKFAGGVVMFFALNLWYQNFSMWDIINIPIMVILIMYGILKE